MVGYDNLPNVELVSHTQDPEKLMAYVARGSNPSNQDNPEYARLFRYMIREKHWSPFEHAHMTCGITTTLDIATQILRHRSFCYQQVSRRYAGPGEVPLEIGIPSLRAPHPKNRQKSIDTLPPDEVRGWQSEFTEVANACSNLYHEMIGAGVAKECARAILPQSTVTKLYMTGNVRSFIHYIALRSGNGTQTEHQQIAAAVKEHFCKVFPCTAQALDEIDWKV